MVVNVNFLYSDCIEVRAKVRLGKTSARGDEPDEVLELDCSDQDGGELPTRTVTAIEERAIEYARYGL